MFVNIFIDTQDMEERYGEELYKEYLEKENQQLKEKYLKAVADYETTKSEWYQLKSTLEEIREKITVKMARYFNEKDYCIEDSDLDELLQIIDKGVNKGE